MTWTDKLKKAIGLYTDPAWFEAAKAGDIARLEGFLKSGVRVNARDQWDDTATALILAADRGHLETVRVLVEAGANLNLHHGKEDKPVLAFAARGGHRAVVDYLQEQGAGWR